MNRQAIDVLLQRPAAAIMGVVNVTPDSFSDGGNFFDVDAALSQALQLVKEGADILDIGAESSRPGADPVSLQQELDRLMPVLERVTQETDTPISIDTYKPQVMTAAVEAGAQMINDINALQAEGAIAAVSDLDVPVCLMHMQGKPSDMQENPEYNQVVDDVFGFLQQRIDACVDGGIQSSNVLLDPGIGFGKTLAHNLTLLNHVSQLKAKLKCEVLIGVSRKSMIGDLLGRPVEQRLAASLGLAVQAVINGAKIVRVHDVQATHDAVRSIEAVLNSSDHTL